jgi:ABC-2 type transport system ATP-binding protein
MDAVETYALTKAYRVARSFVTMFQTRTLQEVLAVDQVSLTVGTGEIFGLVGSNGAGKTTLINLLCTLAIPSAGTARVGGLDVRQEPAGVRRLIGLVTSNERSFYWRLSGRQNLRFFAELYRLPSRDIPDRIAELLTSLDLDTYADRRFDSYSTGIRQRLAFARALLHRPPILFMDEPTKGLDPVAAVELVRLIRERIMALWSPTIIITSHNLQEIEQLCDRLAIMHRGRIIQCGSLEELRRRVCAHNTYSLTVGKLPPRGVEAISGLRGVLGLCAVRNNGHLQLDLQLNGDGKALSAVLQTVLASGGEVYRCLEVPLSLQEIFHRILSSHAEH